MLESTLLYYNTKMTEIESIRGEIEQAYKRIKTWRGTAEEFGISTAMAWQIVVNNHEPKQKDIRDRLGLQIMKPAPVCACGEVHTTKRCPHLRQRKPKSLFDMPAKELLWALENREEA